MARMSGATNRRSAASSAPATASARIRVEEMSRTAAGTRIRPAASPDRPNAITRRLNRASRPASAAVHGSPSRAKYSGERSNRRHVSSPMAKVIAASGKSAASSSASRTNNASRVTPPRTRPPERSESRAIMARRWVKVALTGQTGCLSKWRSGTSSRTRLHRRRSWRTIHSCPRCSGSNDPTITPRVRVRRASSVRLAMVTRCMAHPARRYSRLMVPSLNKLRHRRVERAKSQTVTSSPSTS